MATLLADPPVLPPPQLPSAPGSGAGAPVLAAPASLEHQSCRKCAAPMLAGQDWCLQCGAGAPDSLGSGSPGWRSAVAVLGAVAILVAVAAVAAFAALNKSAGKPRAATASVRHAALAPAVPLTPAAPSALPGTTAKVGAPTTVKPVGPLIKPPRIPLRSVTPNSSAPTPPISPAITTPTASKIAPGTTPNAGSPPPAEAHGEAILLDTNAAATYNPYAYPASNFGDPSLAIDGDASTGWTARLDPAVAPRMAEGLVVDLKSAQKLSALALTTTTPGVTIQVYGASTHTLPASITDHAWVQLSKLVVEKKKHVSIKLRDATTAFEFVVLWISRAPAASVGTPQAPGRVSVNELELFPTGK